MVRMRIIDLTMNIHERMLNYPTNPSISIKQHHFVEKDHENTFKMMLNSQLGTHIETGYFVNDDLPKITDIPVRSFIGTAAVADVPCRMIAPSDLIPQEQLIRRHNFLLLRSGYLDRIQQITQTEIEDKNRPYISMDTAKWLIEKNVSFIGIDSFGFDPFTKFDVHKHLLMNNVLIAEGLVNLGQIRKKTVLIMAFPLKVLGAEAAPSRIIAIEDASLVDHARIIANQKGDN